MGRALVSQNFFFVISVFFVTFVVSGVASRCAVPAPAEAAKTGAGGVVL